MKSGICLVRVASSGFTAEGRSARQEAIQIDCSSHRRRVNFSRAALQTTANDLPLQGVVRKFSGLVSPHRGCTPNKFLEQFGFVGASLTLTVTVTIGLIVVQRTGVGTFYQARR